MKIKNKSNDNKVSGKADNSKNFEKISFSFKYMTAKSHYSFSHFGKNKNDCMKAKADLYDRMEIITSETWTYWNGQNKFIGVERLPASEIEFAPKGYEFTADEKVIVFRFCSDKYRIIGIKLKDDSTYYVIGYDFDYSAYNHGK